MLNNLDLQMMTDALALAKLGRFSTSPNPRVGCIIAHGSQIVGQGFHVKAGEGHAEVNALKQAGHLARNATAYVTLEPCSHFGRTPPCALALVEAGVSRVVIAMQDPNPLVAGKGIAILKEAGVKVSCGILEAEANQLNRGFLSRINRKRPFIRLKCAVSLDGKTALSTGESQWITGEKARADVQIMRAESCAILTGIGTVLKDNPRLTVRDFPTIRHPSRVVLDSQLRIPESSHLIQDNTAPTLILTLNNTNEVKIQTLSKYAHVKVIKTESHNNQISLDHALKLLAQEGFGEIMIEAGATLATSFLKANLLDEIVLYQSPKILGDSACGLFTCGENILTLTQPAQWNTTAVSILDNDIKWQLEPSPSNQ